jgi:hypothetical protein
MVLPLPLDHHRRAGGVGIVTWRRSLMACSDGGRLPSLAWASFWATGISQGGVSRPPPSM